MGEWVGLLLLLLVIGWILYLMLNFGILARVTDYTDKTPATSLDHEWH